MSRWLKYVNHSKGPCRMSRASRTHQLMLCCSSQETSTSCARSSKTCSTPWRNTQQTSQSWTSKSPGWRMIIISWPVIWNWSRVSIPTWLGPSRDLSRSTRSWGGKILRLRISYTRRRSREARPLREQDLALCLRALRTPVAGWNPLRGLQSPRRPTSLRRLHCRQLRGQDQNQTKIETLLRMRVSTYLLGTGAALQKRAIFQASNRFLSLHSAMPWQRNRPENAWRCNRLKGNTVSPKSEAYIIATP